MTRQCLVTAVLALAAVTAGCAGGGPATPTPTEGQTNVTVSVENDGESPYHVEILLVPERLTQLTVTGDNGVARPVTNLSAVRGVYAFAWRNVTAVRLPPEVEAHSSTRFQLAPTDRAETRLSVPAGDATLVVVIGQTDRVAAWATTYCGRENALDRVDVRASAGNPGRFTAIDLACVQR